MRFTAALACWIVAAGAADKAMGGEQSVFTADSLWLWWVAAAFWTVAGVRVLIDGAD